MTDQSNIITLHAERLEALSDTLACSNPETDLDLSQPEGIPDGFILREDGIYELRGNEDSDEIAVRICSPVIVHGLTRKTNGSGWAGSMISTTALCLGRGASSASLRYSSRACRGRSSALGARADHSRTGATRSAGPASAIRSWRWRLRAAQRHRDELVRRTSAGSARAAFRGRRSGNRTNLHEAQRKGVVSNLMRADRKAQELADFVERTPGWSSLTSKERDKLLNRSGLFNLISERRGERKEWTQSSLRKPLLKAEEELRLRRDLEGEENNEVQLEALIRFARTAGCGVL